MLVSISILKEMENLMSKFQWSGGKNNEKTFHLISWNKIKKPTHEGGLQIWDLCSNNLAIGAKVL